MDLNRATILGRLTRDPETRTTTSGITVTSFSVATSTVWTDAATKEKREQTEFHNVVAWRRLGEIVAQYLRKGSQVYVEGKIQTRSWDGQDGSKKYRTEIVADNLIMLGSKAAGAGTAAPAAATAEKTIEIEEPTPHLPAGPPAERAGRQEPAAPDAETISVEDIPF